MAQLILSGPSHRLRNPGTMCAASTLAAASSRSVSYGSCFATLPLSSTIGLKRSTLEARFCTAKLFVPRPYRRQSILLKAGLSLPGPNAQEFEQSREWFEFAKSLTRAFFICSSIAFVAWHARAPAAFASAAIPSAKSGTAVITKEVWPKVFQVLNVFKEQGLLLSVLLGLSAFFSMAETSITTLWPWKVRELAEKEQDGGVFQLLQQDVTRFLTTILIGTTIANIAATALVTDAATALFGEAGVGAATAAMTVVLLLLTEIAPKSIAVHNATQVARIVVRPVAWLSVVLYPVGRVVTVISTAMLKLFGLKSSGEPFVTEEELRVMLRGAELSGAIEEEEQDMIENLLEIKDTHVREVMTPLVDVVAIDARSTLMEFRDFWVKQQYSRVPVFERRIDNIVGIAYAMDMLDYLEQRELLHKLTVGRIAHKPAYFVPDSMSVWNLLREFRIRKVHMAIVINEYGGAVGIVTLEDVVEEIVGEIFDENDSKEEIRKKTGYVVQRGEGVFDVDANTSIEDLSEALQVKFPEEHDYETVSGFVCESFGYIPRTGESIKVVLRNKDAEENGDNKEREGEPENHEEKREKFQTYKLEILAGNARKVGAARFEVLDASKSTEEMPRPLPRFVRRAWDDQCEESGPEDGKVAILWDGKSIPCARSDSEPCDTADEYEDNSNRNPTNTTVDAEIVISPRSMDDDVHDRRKSSSSWTREETEDVDDGDDDEVDMSSAMAFEKSMERRRQRRRKQAVDASAELRRAEMKRREADVSLRKPKEEKP